MITLRIYPNTYHQGCRLTPSLLVPGHKPFLAQLCLGWKLDPAIRVAYLRLTLVLWLVELLLFPGFMS